MLRLNESGLSICGNYYVEQLVNYVRKNDYPALRLERVFFSDHEDYALCSELDKQVFSLIVWSLEQGRYDKKEGEYLDRFDGGVYLVHGREYYVLVDGHLYFFDF